MERIKNFYEFLNEAETSEPALAPTMSTSTSGSAGARFQFPKGKYKVSDISPDELEKLRNDIAINILAKLKDGNAWTGPTMIDLVASTSTINVTPELRKQLSTEGFPEKPGDKTGNYALCQARLKTIKDLMYGMLQIDPADKTATDKFAKIYTVTETPKPDQSASEKDQYIQSTVRYTGKQKDMQINCKDATTFSGAQGSEENNYVGFGKDDLAFVASPNTKAVFNLRPGNIPDCFFWYQNPTSYGLTPFIGNKVSREKTGDWEYNGKINSVKGGNYFKQGHFQDRLNDEDKKDGIIDAIKKEISKFIDPGAADKLVKEKLLDEDGKIKVIEPKEDPKAFVTEVLKNVDAKDLVIRVFSPLGDTQFSVLANCSLPQIDTKTGKINGYKQEQ
jgi:hypothetical protein